MFTLVSLASAPIPLGQCRVTKLKAIHTVDWVTDEWSPSLGNLQFIRGYEQTCPTFPWREALFLLAWSDSKNIPFAPDGDTLPLKATCYANILEINNLETQGINASSWDFQKCKRSIRNCLSTGEFSTHLCLTITLIIFIANLHVLFLESIKFSTNSTRNILGTKILTFSSVYQ